MRASTAPGADFSSVRATVRSGPARDPQVALAGRREGVLLELPSVARMADVLSRRCADQVWVRMAVASLDRFATLTATDDLEALLARARTDAAVADVALASLAAAVAEARHGSRPAGSRAERVAGVVTELDLGPKLWFRLNGVPVAWRSWHLVTAPGVEPVELTTGMASADRVALLGLIGSGLYLAELLRLRIGDLGVLEPDGRVAADLEAAPLAVRFHRRRGRVGDWVTFLAEPARRAVLQHVATRADAGLDVGLDAPLVAGPTGNAATAATVRTARQRSEALIRVGSTLNVDMCRKTGEFFREWGLPGSRFSPTTSRPSFQP
jgi:hypothetical protein